MRKLLIFGLKDVYYSVYAVLPTKLSKIQARKTTEYYFTIPHSESSAVFLPAY